MANKCPNNIKYSTFLSKYLGLSQDINQSTKKTKKKKTKKKQKTLQCHHLSSSSKMNRKHHSVKEESVGQLSSPLLSPMIV